MKLDVEIAKFLDAVEYRVLTAIEIGSRNHELVPFELIASIAKAPGGSSRVRRALSTLHKHKLVFHDGSNYNGYRLTSMGYDYLALKALLSRGSVSGVGTRIGVGKESDIFEAEDGEGKPIVLKFHRLGRTSFRDVKNKRDYLGGRQSAGSWMFLSRLAAEREYKYMKGLYDCDFPVPTPFDWSRHCVVMSRVWGYPMTQIDVGGISDAQRVYETLMELIVKLAEHGVIHGDFNEFNLMMEDNGDITLIDFPQMISINHVHALEQFDRDISCIKAYFAKRQRIAFVEMPSEDIFEGIQRKAHLDVQLECSGYDASMKESLEVEKVNGLSEEVEEIEELSELVEQNLIVDDEVKKEKRGQSKKLDRNSIREILKKKIKDTTKSAKAGKMMRNKRNNNKERIIAEGLR